VSNRRSCKLDVRRNVCDSAELQARRPTQCWFGGGVYLDRRSVVETQTAARGSLCQGSRLTVVVFHPTPAESYVKLRAMKLRARAPCDRGTALSVGRRKYVLLTEQPVGRWAAGGGLSGTSNDFVHSKRERGGGFYETRGLDVSCPKARSSRLELDAPD
jgi:hypothetical protein